MIVLQVSSQKLEALLAASTSTTPLDITVVYYDQPRKQNVNTPSVYLPFYVSQESTISSATVTTICAAPIDGVSRCITAIFGYNRDVTSATLTIDKNLGNASTLIKKHTLTTGQTLWYEHGDGWEVL